MKNSLAVVIVVVLAAAVQYFQGAAGFLQPRYLENVVNTTFNQILASKIKPLDPLNIPRVETGALGTNVVAEDITIEGFSNAYLSNIKLSGVLSPKLEATLLIPRVTSKVGNLEVDLEDGSTGRVSADLLLRNLRIGISANIKIIGLTATNVKVKPNLEHGEVIIKGDEDEAVLQEITDLFNYFLNYTLNNDVDLHNQISSIVQGIIDDLL